MQRFSDTRRAFIATVGLAVPALAANKKRGPTTAPPNIVLIVADELAAGMLGCYGNKDLRTPGIDALARRGVRFQNAVASSRGGASGRGTLLSGRTPMQASGGGDGQLLTDLLSAAGYDVAYVGALGLGNDQQPGHGIRWAYTLSGDHSYWNGAQVQDQGDAPAIVSRRACQFLDQQKLAPGKQFFLAISNPPSAGVPALDSQVQTVAGKLHELGLEESTLIVFTSAGGTPGSIHIPLICCWPGRAPVEATRPDMVGGYDLMPTLCAAANVDLPEGNLCGRSYLLLVEGRPLPKKEPWRTVAYGSFSEPAGPADVAIDNGFKLVIRNDGKGSNQLLDRRADPSKPVVNQYSNRAFITIRDGMRKSLNQWKTQYSRL